MPDALILDHRSDLQTLTGLARRDLTLIWSNFAVVVDADLIRDGLVEILPQLVDMYGSAAATLGADWYDELRAAAEVDGRFTAIAAELPDTGRTDALAGWAVEPLFTAQPDHAAALAKAAGGLQRIIADADRQSVMQSSIADPGATGWQRVTRTGSCGFCSMVAGRGSVYRESTASFASHDHCHCHAAPAFEGHTRPVRPYTPSTHSSTEAERALARDWIRKNL